METSLEKLHMDMVNSRYLLLLACESDEISSEEFMRLFGVFMSRMDAYYDKKESLR